tara:strand:+ start:851 stop:1078 length:228 start_codon:yes stop_codon:yes gene_type:complete
MKKENIKKDTIDPISLKVVRSVIQRSLDMNQKHGNRFYDVNRSIEGLIHDIEEELIDGLVYLEKLKSVLDGKKIH